MLLNLKNPNFDILCRKRTFCAVRVDSIVKSTYTSTDTISASEYTVAYRRTKDAAGNTVTEDTVSAPENAGTYDVIVTAKSGSAFVTGTKTVTDGITIQPKPFTDNQGNVGK